MQTTFTLNLENTRQTTAGRVGFNSPLSIPFNYAHPNDISVLIDGVINSDWEWKGATAIQLTRDFSNNDLPVEVKIQRNTNLDNLPSFNPGSAIRAQDLNAVVNTLKMAVEDLQSP